jgi:hypothetical protein
MDVNTVVVLFFILGLIILVAIPHGASVTAGGEFEDRVAKRKGKFRFKLSPSKSGKTPRK